MSSSPTNIIPIIIYSRYASYVIRYHCYFYICYPLVFHHRYYTLCDYAQRAQYHKRYYPARHSNQLTLCVEVYRWMRTEHLPYYQWAHMNALNILILLCSDTRIQMSMDVMRRSKNCYIYWSYPLNYAILSSNDAHIYDWKYHLNRVYTLR